MTDVTTAQPRRLGIMIDTESLGLSSKCVVTQLALLAYDLDDPEEYLALEEQFLPITPQTILGREINGDTVLWWMKQSDAARAMFEQNSGNDYPELYAKTAHFFDHIKTLTEDRSEVEIWARGTDHDISILKSLAEDLNLTLPWKYDTVRDLRTLMSAAGVGKREIAPRVGYIEHHALSDCKHQLDCYIEAQRRLRAAR
jgi:hypothetical protein